MNQLPNAAIIGVCLVWLLLVCFFVAGVYRRNPKATAQLSFQAPAQLDQRIIEARYKVDAATGFLREPILEEVRADLMPTKAELLARRDWTQPEDPEDVENNDRSGLYWTAKEDEDLLASFCAGVSPEDIAQDHGRTVYALAKRLEQKHRVLFTRRGQKGFFMVANKQPWGSRQ